MFNQLMRNHTSESYLLCRRVTSTERKQCCFPVAEEKGSQLAQHASSCMANCQQASTALAPRRLLYIFVRKLLGNCIWQLRILFLSEELHAPALFVCNKPCTFTSPCPCLFTTWPDSGCFIPWQSQNERARMSTCNY